MVKNTRREQKYRMCVLEYLLNGGGKPKIETFMETILDEIIDSYIILYLYSNDYY